MLYRPSLGINWQSASNFQQHQSPQIITPRRYPKEQINHTLETNAKVTKLYTPAVHIISPAVYLHTNTPQTSRTVYDGNAVNSPQMSDKTELKDNNMAFKT
jgi:hypothetical protein